jgi:transposase
VRQVFADHLEELESKLTFETPRLMGIDELKIIGSYRAITNVERNTIFDMRETRAKSDLLPYFRKLRGKDRIEWVTIDMYHVYRQGAQNNNPFPDQGPFIPC